MLFTVATNFSTRIKEMEKEFMRFPVSSRRCRRRRSRHLRLFSFLF